MPPRLADGVDGVSLRRIARKEFRRLVRTVERLGPHPDEAAMHALHPVQAFTSIVMPHL